MKIYTKVVFDLETLEQLSEDAYEYDGPITECISTSSSSGGSSQQMMDPEAARRMAAVAERSAALGEEQWKYYQDVFRPYETAMAQSNESLIGDQEAMTRAGLQAQTELTPYRTDAARGALEGISQDIGLSQGLASKFYDEAMRGVDPDARAGQARADVAQAYDGSMGSVRREMGRMGYNTTEGAMGNAMNQYGMDRSKAMAGAMTTARTQAQQENFGRLGTAMGGRSAALSAGAQTTPYQTGTTNQGNFQLGSPSSTAMGAFGNAIGANQAGMGTLTTTHQSSQGFGIL